MIGLQSLPASPPSAPPLLLPELLLLPLLLPLLDELLLPPLPLLEPLLELLVLPPLLELLLLVLPPLLVVPSSPPSSPPLPLPLPLLAPPSLPPAPSALHPTAPPRPDEATMAAKSVAATGTTLRMGFSPSVAAQALQCRGREVSSRNPDPDCAASRTPARTVAQRCASLRTSVPARGSLDWPVEEGFREIAPRHSRVARSSLGERCRTCRPSVRSDVVPGEAPPSMLPPSTPAAVLPAAPVRTSLLVMSRIGVFTYPLPESGEVTVGRGADCHVRIDDAKVSRCHVRLAMGPVVRLVDAGSANGTFLGGRRLDPEAPVDLALGDMVTLGTTVLVLQQTAASSPARVWSQAAFEARVAEERARAASGGPGYAIVRVRLATDAVANAQATTRAQMMSEVARAEALDRTLRETLRKTDVVGAFAPGVYHVLLVRSDADEAERQRCALDTALRTAGFDAEVDTPHAEHRDDEPLRAAPPASASIRTAAPAREQAYADDGATLDRIAASAINVLVLGETGVGKEVMARRLHQRSPRADAPMLCINCAALSESLLESELFGFEKGAFTGATQSKPGLLESAQGGTVFLDEVGEMPLALQAKLLRVLEQREVLRVGALKTRPIDVRFVSATNRDLEAEIAAGRFRRDLYFRLHGMAVRVRPLRERVREIEPLARAFVAEACAQARRAAIPEIAPAALALLNRYGWPGNVRELRNVMERAVVLCTGDVIEIDHLPGDAMAPRVELGREPRGPEVEALAALYDPDPERERARILDALTRSRGNQTQAAAQLGISRRTLINKLEQFKLPRPRKRS